MSEENKIQVDMDWKAQAQAEKDRLVQQEEAAKAEAARKEAEEQAAAEAASGAGAQEMPEASFTSLVSNFTTQAMAAMGGMPDPRTGQRMLQLDLARYYIGLMEVIFEKTQGNLEEDESRQLQGALYELRSQYVMMSQAWMKQATGSGQGAARQAGGSMFG